jgi:hypothetical protein
MEFSMQLDAGKRLCAAIALTALLSAPVSPSAQTEQ